MVCRVDRRPQQILVGGLVTLGLLVACGAALRPWVARWVAGATPVDRAARRALAIDPSNDRIQAVLATVYHYGILLRDYPAALRHYQATLRSNPLDSTSWLQLAKLYRKLGRSREAERALSLAVRLAPTDSTILWEATLVHLEEGQVPDALLTLGRFISVAGDDDVRARGYDLSLRLRSPREALDRLIPAEVRHYERFARYLLDRGRWDDALEVWDRLTKMGDRARERIDHDLQLRFVDLLIAKGRHEPAHEAWTGLVRRVEPASVSSGVNLVFNGSFERRDTLGRGFDWKVEPADGIAWDLDASEASAGRRSLRVSFEKARGTFAHVSQTVRVEPDAAYVFEAHIRTNGLDGQRGMYFEIVDPRKGLLARTQTVSGTEDWTKVVASFRTAAHSQIILLRLRKEPPPPSLPPKAATAWIDDVSIITAN